MKPYLERSGNELPVPFSPTRCGTFKLVALFFFFAVSLLAQSTSTISLRISSENAPPGGYAQFKISLISPALVSTASVSMSLDPTIFGPIANVAAFSATGDQLGYANLNGQQLTGSVSSSSASLGQLPGLPVFIVTVPILATAKSGTTSSIAVDPSQSPWQDQEGNSYNVSVVPGTFTVGGTVSVQSVTPGGGVLPTGTVIAVAGTGFDIATTVTIDGVNLASTQFVSAQQINVTLGGTTEMTGKHLHVLTGSGMQSTFFCSLPSSPANTTSTVFPLLPLTTYANVAWDFPLSARTAESVALLNQNLSPVTVTFLFASSSGAATIAPSITIPSGALYFLNTSSFTSGLGELAMVATAPMRMLEYRVIQSNVPPYSAQSSVLPPTALIGLPNLLQPTASLSGLSGGTWTWQIGYATPSPVSVALTGTFGFTATVSASAAAWLSVSPAQGTEPATLTLTPNVSSLAAGTYGGTVTIKSILPPSLASLSVQDIVLPVKLQVSASPFITASGTNYFTSTAGFVTPSTGTISVSTSGTQAQFSTSVTTNSGGSWLFAAPTTGSTPGSISLTVSPNGLCPGTYMGNVVIQGPANSVSFAVEFVITHASSGPAPLSANPATLQFALAAGTSGVQAPQLVSVQPTLNFTIGVQTQSGGNWLTAVFLGGVSVTASAIGLGPGTYLGIITLTSTTNGSVQIPVTLVVLAPSAPLSVIPENVALTIHSGQSATQSFNISSTPSTLYSYATFTPGPEQWVTQGFSNSSFTPATVTLTFLSTQPGTHYGSVTFTSGSGSITVPIMLTVTASTALQPILGSIVSAASGIPSSISPGEIISLYGTGIGSTPSGLTLDAAGNVATKLDGTQVTINNVAAPLIYVSSGQVNAIVPYEVGSSGVASIQVTANGLQSPMWSVALAPAGPSIFTIGSTGVGHAAVLNQDNSTNGGSDAAARGTTIQIFATGGGQTSPACITGSFASAASMSLSPVTVTIGGQNAVVTYQGAAPGEVCGLLQVNAVVPQGASVGSDALTLTMGGQQSQADVTVVVK